MMKRTRKENRFLKIVNEISDDDDVAHYYQFPHLKVKKPELKRAIHQTIDETINDSKNVDQNISSEVKNECDASIKEDPINNLFNASEAKNSFYEIPNNEIRIDNVKDKDDRYKIVQDKDDDGYEKVQDKDDDGYDINTNKNKNPTTKTSEINHGSSKNKRKRSTDKSSRAEIILLDRMTSDRLNKELQNMSSSIKRAESITRSIENRLELLKDRQCHFQNILLKSNIVRENHKIKSDEFVIINSNLPITSEFKEEFESLNILQQPPPAHQPRYKMELIVPEMSLDNKAHGNKRNLTGCTYLVCKK